MPAKFYEMRFRAVPAVDVSDPFTPPSGACRMLGKTWDPEAQAYTLDPEPALVRLAEPQFFQAKGLFRRCVTAGELLCADKATAVALGLPGALIAPEPPAPEPPAPEPPAPEPPAAEPAAAEPAPSTDADQEPAK